MILAEVNTLLDGIGVPVETGYFSGEAPQTYAVLTPLTDEFDLYADNVPGMDTQEIRLTLFVKGNYLRIKNRIVRVLLAADMTVTDRRYIQFDRETGYYQYAIDVEKTYTYMTEE